MVAGSILPIAFHNNQLFFLFGKENALADTPGFSDFGGGLEPGETPYKTALREGSEELSGFLGTGKDIDAMIKKAGGPYKLVNKTYHVHMFLMEYDENLVKCYNNSHRFLWERMDQKMLNDSKLFEKIEIAWFSADQMKLRKNEFRDFYQNIVDDILMDMPNIKRFIMKTSKNKTRRQKKRLIGG
jgi:hypothetical protein